MDIQVYKQILKDRNMTYVDLSEETGLSLGCIKRIMAGIARYPRIDTIETINKALGIDNEIHPEDRTHGASELETVNVTPLEKEMLLAFRDVGKKRGIPAQKTLIEVAEKML